MTFPLHVHPIARHALCSFREYRNNSGSLPDVHIEFLAVVGPSIDLNKIRPGLRCFFSDSFKGDANGELQLFFERQTYLPPLVKDEAFVL